MFEQNTFSNICLYIKMEHLSELFTKCIIVHFMAFWYLIIVWQKIRLLCWWHCWQIWTFVGQDWKWNYEYTCHWKPGQDRHGAQEQNAKREAEKPATKNDKDFKEKFTKSKYLRSADIEIGRPEEKMWLTTGDPGCWLKRTSLSGNFFVFPLLYDNNSNFVIIIICLLIYFLLKMTPATDSSAQVCLALFESSHYFFIIILISVIIVVWLIIDFLL